MSTYTVTDPEGVEWDIDGPQGSTEEEALDHFKSQWKPSQLNQGERFVRGAKAATVDPWDRLSRSWGGEDVYAPGEKGFVAESKRLGGAALDMAGGPLSVATLGASGGLLALLKGGLAAGGLGGLLDTAHVPEQTQKYNDSLAERVSKREIGPLEATLKGTFAETIPSIVPEGVAGMAGRRFSRPQAPSSNQSLALVNARPATNFEIIRPSAPIGLSKLLQKEPRIVSAETSEPKVLRLNEADPWATDPIQSEISEAPRKPMAPEDMKAWTDQGWKESHVLEAHEMGLNPKEFADVLLEYKSQFEMDSLEESGGVAPLRQFVRNNGGISKEGALRDGLGGEYTLEEFGGDSRLISNRKGSKGPEQQLMEAIEAGLVHPDMTLNEFGEALKNEGLKEDAFIRKHNDGYTERGRGILNDLNKKVRKKGTASSFDAS